VDHHRAVANRRGGSVTRSSMNDDVAVVHGFRQTPAGTPLDMNLGAIDQPAAVVAHAALKTHSSRLQQSYPEVVTGIGVLHANVGRPALQAGPDQRIDFPGGKRRGIDRDCCYLDHTRTSSTWASETL
jgi:hypothetical protein